jgi:hypothetical protein
MFTLDSTQKEPGEKKKDQKSQMVNTRRRRKQIE